MLSSLIFFILDVSMIILQDCLTAFFKICSSEFAFADFGDLISNSTPSRRISAVLVFDSGMNSTACPARARILATRCS